MNCFGETAPVVVVSVVVFGGEGLALAGLAKGAEVYVAGRLSLNAWTGKDGTQRTGSP